jgi:hypothetical protein
LLLLLLKPYRLRRLPVIMIVIVIPMRRLRRRPFISISG